MSNKVGGVVCHIEPTQTYGAKGFKKRQIVLEQDKGSFTNYVPIEVTRDMCDEIDEINIGDEVAFTFRLNGRKWQKDESSEVRYFLSAEALSYEILTRGSGPASTANDDDEAPF